MRLGSVPSEPGLVMSGTELDVALRLVAAVVEGDPAGVGVMREAAPLALVSVRLAGMVAGLLGADEVERVEALRALSLAAQLGALRP